MTNHWFFSRLIVLVAIYGVLGTTITNPALAAVKKPFPCWTCCPNGPLCSRDPDRISYRIMIGRATYYGNTEAAGTKLTSSQLTDLAKRIRNYQIEADANGDIAAQYFFVKWNAPIFKAVKFDTSQLVPGINSMGSKAKQAQLAKMLAGWSQAERIAYVNDVLAYGIDWEITTAINALNEMAKYTAAVELAISRGDPLPPVREFCTAAASVGQVFGFIAAVAIYTGQLEIAAPMGLIAASAGLAYGIGGCN